MVLISIIGTAARVLLPCENGRRRTRRGTGQKSQSVQEVVKFQGGGVSITLSTDSDSSSSTDTDTAVTIYPTSSLPPSWKPAGGQASLPRSQDEPIQNEDEADRIMARSRDLPTTWYYSSNHVMVNRERTKRTIAPLVRMIELDEIAREHVEDMAEQNTTFHSDTSFLRMPFNQPARLGENVAKGRSIRKIHNQMMDSSSVTNNILDRRYTHFGMATAKASDGELFICQIFRG
jgi:uncharacterized protein YkwD